LHKGVLGIRSFYSQLTKNIATLWQGVTGSRIGWKTWLCLVIPVLTICTIISLARCAVVWDGEVLVVARDREIAETALQHYIKQLEKTTGMPVEIKEDTIKYRPVWQMGALADGEDIQRCLADKLECQYEASGIFIDGHKVAAVKNTAAGQKVLANLLDKYTNEGLWETAFKQKVAVKPVSIDLVEIMDPEQATEYILRGGINVGEYQVEAGDTLWDVAEATNVTTDELIVANPGLTPESMQVGQTIQISSPAPLVDVVSTYQDVQQEEILFHVQQKVDQNLYWGEQKILQKGRSGEREVAYKVTLENGLETSRTVVQQKTTQEAVPQIIAKGNKKLLAFRGGNGRLAYPTSGAIVSPFGARWGKTHEGVDIATNLGTPVVAAEVGTIQRSGYLGAYGLSIDISHGSGVVTRYAHLSSAAVEPGQRVERGQFIGRAGSTGRSTGPHLHFEVMVNGIHKNPTIFI